MEQLRRQILAMALVVVSVLAIEQVLVGTAAGATGPIPSRHCLVRLSGLLSASASSPSDEIQFRVAPDCTVTTAKIPNAHAGVGTSTVRGFASLTAQTYYRGCRSSNAMYGAFGQSLTWLNSDIYFLWDDVSRQVTGGVSYSAAPGANQNYFLWGSPPPTGDITTPAWSVYVQEQEAFGYHDLSGDFYSHTKSNVMYGYGDGTCSTQFAHWNYVCGGCTVDFRLYYL